MTQPPWMSEAWRDFGQREISGAHHNARIVAMFRDAGHERVVNDETAWCAAYAGANLKRAGIAPSGSLMARSYLQWGRVISNGQPGAIVVFARGTDPALGHVGFWLGETDDSIVVLGGNQGDQVSVARYPKYRLLGLRWPTDAPKPVAQPHAVDSSEMFAIGLAHVLEMEGGYTDDPFDAGGPTNKGITLKTYASWLKLTLDATNIGSLKGRLKTISDSMVREIYEARYWRPSSAASLPAPLALMHFDASVNHGVGRAIGFLQTAVGVEADGEIGPITLQAAAEADVTTVLSKYAELRLASYRLAKSYPRFGVGWQRRVAATLTKAHTLNPNPKPNPTAQKGTSMTEQMTIPANEMTGSPKWWGQSMTIWGTLITAAATILPALGPIIGITLTPDMIQELGAAVPATLQALTALFGTIMAIYGRMRATQPLQRRLVTLML
jgi:uncharacterized protein (TIGR02594 family)